MGQISVSRNVKDYGAIGDGVHDDSHAFRLCFAATGGHFDVPPGIYRITEPIPLVEND